MTAPKGKKRKSVTVWAYTWQDREYGPFARTFTRKCEAVDDMRRVLSFPNRKCGPITRFEVPL